MSVSTSFPNLIFFVVLETVDEQDDSFEEQVDVFSEVTDVLSDVFCDVFADVSTSDIFFPFFELFKKSKKSVEKS